mgnify:CR=1 FL=1
MIKVKKIIGNSMEKLIYFLSGVSSRQSGCPTALASTLALSRLMVLFAFSTSLRYGWVKPVVFVISFCVSPASFLARLKLRANTCRS